MNYFLSHSEAVGKLFPLKMEHLLPLGTEDTVEHSLDFAGDVGPSPVLHGGGDFLTIPHGRESEFNRSGYGPRLA
jgi:hypothetical protein